MVDVVISVRIYVFHISIFKETALTCLQIHGKYVVSLVLFRVED